MCSCPSAHEDAWLLVIESWYLILEMRVVVVGCQKRWSNVIVPMRTGRTARAERARKFIVDGVEWRRGEGVKEREGCSSTVVIPIAIARVAGQSPCLPLPVQNTKPPELISWQRTNY
jgi:hypothetical protein